MEVVEELVEKYREHGFEHVIEKEENNKFKLTFKKRIKGSGECSFELSFDGDEISLIELGITAGVNPRIFKVGIISNRTCSLVSEEGFINYSKGDAGFKSYDEMEDADFDEIDNYFAEINEFIPEISDLVFEKFPLWKKGRER